MQIHTMPRIGRWSGVGLAMLTASVVSWFSILDPLQQEVAAQRGDLRRAEMLARRRGPGPASLASQADAFIRRLPTVDELPAVLSTVVAQADEAGLQLERGDYEFTMARTGVIARYQLTLPVAGTYLQIQQFVHGTLAALPPVALEGLRLERDSVGDQELHADLRFVVMVRSGR